MKKKYLISGLIVLTILLITCLIKGLFPFGNKIMAWGDMHAQILTLYYNLHDIVYNGKSIFSAFSSGIVSSTIPNIAYYILSPLSLIILLFKRSDIPQAVNIIIILKFAISAITCNYFLDRQFTKLNVFYKVFFSVLYALSTYNFSNYIITGWIDVVYLFPILLVGLLSLLKEKKVKLFIVVLCLSLIFNFYIAFMCIVFIFFSSFIYLKFYQKSEIKEKISLLGISTVISFLISSFVLIPSILQIVASARTGFNFSQMLSSKFGPMVDKFAMLSSLGAMFSCAFLAFKQYKKNKKWLLFLAINIFLVGVSLIIEPINKMLHFGSYMYYPLRYGFILVLLMIIGSCIFLEKNECSKENRIIPIITTIICNVLIIFISSRFYNTLQQSVFSLSFSFNHFSFYLIVILLLLNIISYLSIFNFCLNKSKIKYICLCVCLLTFTLTQSMIYVGIDTDEKEAHTIYDQMNSLYNYNFDDNYHIKKSSDVLIENFGYVIDKPTQDFWTSLTDNNMFIGYQKLGYDSKWMDISSNGSNIFVDMLLSNKYLITNNTNEMTFYELLDQINDLKIYNNTLVKNLGYEIKENSSIEGAKNSFEASNIMYSTLIDSRGTIFDIYTDFDFHNSKYDNSIIKVLSDESEAYITSDIKIDGKKILYLDLTKTYLNKDKIQLYSSFDVYVNNNLVKEDYPSKTFNGTLELGLFEDQIVEVKLVIKKPVIKDLYGIQIGALDYDKLIEFFEKERESINISYNKNKILVNYSSSDNNILFLPIPNLNGLTAKVNGKTAEIIPVFDYFVGIKLNKGDNIISFKYITPGLKIGVIFSLTGIILALLFGRYKNKILEFKNISKLFYILYITLYILLLLVFYILPFFIFLLAFIR